MEKHTILIVFLLLIEAVGLFDGVLCLQDEDDYNFVSGRELKKFKNHHRNTNKRLGRNSSTKNKISTNKTTTIEAVDVEFQTGATATLNCEVKLDDATILWMKKNGDSDMILLTVNDTTHTRDKRYRADRNEKNPQMWSLYIRYTQNSDAGLYECQICSNETKIIYVRLILKEAIAEIFGKPTKVVKPGSPLRLSCILRHSIEPPMYIFWYHRDKMINYNLGTGAAIRHGRQGSELIFPRAEIHHSGNYSCVPSNARQASVLVHVTQRADELPTALLHGGINGGAFIYYNIWNTIPILALYYFC